MSCIVLGMAKTWVNFYVRTTAGRRRRLKSLSARYGVPMSQVLDAILARFFDEHHPLADTLFNDNPADR